MFIQKSAVNLLSSVLDTPEFFWHAPDSFQTLYTRYVPTVEWYLCASGRLGGNHSGPVKHLILALVPTMGICVFAFHVSMCILCSTCYAVAQLQIPCCCAHCDPLLRLCTSASVCV